ncbi:MAG: flagellar hook-basal body complex protein FliE [Lachnospiraceae bacterium]
MNIASLTNISSTYITNALEEAQSSKQIAGSGSQEESFDSVLFGALSALKETNQLQQQAENAQIAFSLGELDNTHDLTIAQEKAGVALQYTVAVRDKILDAYKEIMNMSM